jgi:c-di-GMP-binding flagellar brake protein YcgR
MMMDDDNLYDDRRRYPRLSPRVYYRIGKSQSLRQRVSNISLGGVRIYSDTRWDIGEEVELELHFASGYADKGKARVVWIKELPPDSGASYDVGLEFIELPEGVAKELAETLKKN